MSIYPGLSCKWSFTATYGVPSSPIIGKYFIGMDWLCGKKDNFILSCISFFLKTICWTGLKFLRVLESAYLSSSAPILLLLAEIHHFDSNNLFHFSWLYVLSKKSEYVVSVCPMLTVSITVSMSMGRVQNSKFGLLGGVQIFRFFPNVNVDFKCFGWI